MTTSSATLAIDGGERAMAALPPRHLFGSEEKAAVDALFDSCIASGEVFSYNGAEEQAYCQEFAQYMGGGYADAVNSGSSAVYVALRSLRLPAFTEVLCGPISDPGGIMPIALCNNIPVPVDGAPGSFNPDPASIAERITEHTSAIVVTHIAGIPADMEAIMQLARSHGLKVVEDCAQAHGADFRGRKVGTWGDVAAFSTMSGKHHATGGQGGVVYTQEEETYWWARRTSDRGKPFNLPGARGNVVASSNLNLNDLSAVIGRVQLRKLPGILARRQESARWLIAACREELQSLRIADGPADANSVYWFLFGQLCLEKLSVDKATFVKALQAEGVPCGPSYLHLFVDHDWYRNRQVFDGTDYPWGCPLYKGDANAEYPVPNIRETDTYTFQLPWHEGITVEVAKQILQALLKVEKAYLK